jgi:hypothetical protein
VRSPHVAKERQAAASLRAARCGGVSPQTRAVDALQTRAPPVMGKPLCKRGETIGDYKISGPFIGEGSFAEARTGCTLQPRLRLVVYALAARRCIRQTGCTLRPTRLSRFVMREHAALSAAGSAPRG